MKKRQKNKSNKGVIKQIVKYVEDNDLLKKSKINKKLQNGFKSNWFYFPCKNTLSNKSIETIRQKCCSMFQTIINQYRKRFVRVYMSPTYKFVTRFYENGFVGEGFDFYIYYWNSQQCCQNIIDQSNYLIPDIWNIIKEYSCCKKCIEYYDKNKKYLINGDFPIEKVEGKYRNSWYENRRNVMSASDSDFLIRQQIIDTSVLTSLSGYKNELLSRINYSLA